MTLHELRELLLSVPEDWKVVPLGELTDYLSRGISPQYVKASNTLILNQKCIQPGGIHYEHMKFLDENVNLKGDSPVYIRSGDVVLNSTGTGTIGRPGYIATVPAPVVADSHVTVIRTKEHLLSGAYLFRQLSSPDIQLLLETLTFTGSTNQVELSRTELSKFPIRLAPLNEQKQIERALSSIDEALEASKAVLEQLFLVKRQTAQELFSNDLAASKPSQYVKHFGYVPAGWQRSTVGEISCFVTSGPRGWAQYYSDQGAAYLRIGDLSKSSIYLEPESTQYLDC